MMNFNVKFYDINKNLLGIKKIEAIDYDLAIEKVESLMGNQTIWIEAIYNTKNIREIIVVDKIAKMRIIKI